jgi:hypothetical protein
MWLSAQIKTSHDFAPRQPRQNILKLLATLYSALVLNQIFSMSGHCHDEHDHLGQDHDHSAHDHSDDIVPALQYSLYQHIDFDRITTLNEAQVHSGKNIVKKTWAERLQVQPELESDADEQLLMHIPFVYPIATKVTLLIPKSFTGQIKLHSILLRTSPSDCAPLTLKIFINRDDVDFGAASELSPVQEFSLSQTSEIQEITVKRALFGKVQNITLFVEDNYGDEVTRISYLGFKGDFMQLGRAPTDILYEAAANPADHKVKGTDVNQMGSSLGGRGHGH